jgi:hypothetical protein
LFRSGAAGVLAATTFVACLGGDCDDEPNLVVAVTSADGSPVPHASVTLDDTCCRGLYVGATERTECVYVANDSGVVPAIPIGGDVDQEPVTCVVTVEAPGFRQAKKAVRVTQCHDAQTEVIVLSQ